MGALAGPSLTEIHAADPRAIISRIPHVLAWTWLNTLISDLANQRLPDSISEDAINKAWRPLPAGRIQASETRRLLLQTIVIVLILSLYLGAVQETLLLMSLNWMYNDLGGSDEGYIGRSLMNSAAFACYGSGALRVAGRGVGSVWNSMTYQWIVLTAAIVFTTMQVQDLKDQDGDRVRSRKTMPLILGDKVARWTIAAPVIFWSFVCPAFWALNVYGYIAPLVLGIVIAIRVILLTSKEADSLTWKTWGYWLMSIYSLPLVNSLTR